MFNKSTICPPIGGCVEVDVDFKKSSHSFPVGCAEVRRGKNKVAVRDSKNPEGHVLFFTHDEWRAFVAGVKNGEFDL